MIDLSESVIHHINTVSGILTCMREALEQGGVRRWTTYFMASGDTPEIVQHFPDLKLPAVVMILKDTVFDDNPRVSYTISAVVCTDLYDDPGEMTVNSICEAVIQVIDGLEYGDASFAIYSSKQIKIDGSILAYELVFTVKDH